MRTISPGLLPQAPIHTRSLTITGRPPKRDEEMDEKQPWKNEEVVLAVVEQRASNLLQGLLCLVMLTGPFLYLLSLIPQGVRVSSRYSSFTECWIIGCLAGFLYVTQLFLLRLTLANPP